MKNPISSWLESLKLFIPKNFMQFTLLVLKTWAEMYMTMAKSLWWLILGLAVAMVYSLHPFIFPGAIGLFLWVIIVTARPALVVKDLRYYINQAVTGVFIVPLFFVSKELIFIVSPYIIMTLFFACDSRMSIRGLIQAPLRAALMTWYKLPIYAVFAVLFYAGCLVPWWIAFPVVMPLLVAFMSRCYVVWIHKDYKEYYEGS